MILAMDLGFDRLILLELFLRLSIDITDSNWIKIMRFPVLLRCLILEHLVIHLHLLLVVLQVAIVDHVVVSLNG